MTLIRGRLLPFSIVLELLHEWNMGKFYRKTAVYPDRRNAQ